MRRPLVPAETRAVAALAMMARPSESRLSAAAELTSPAAIESPVSSWKMRINEGYASGIQFPSILCTIEKPCHDGARAFARSREGYASFEGIHQAVIEFTYKMARRIIIGVVGVTVVLIGIVMLVAPGPGLIVIPAGLAILGLEFAWARVWLRKLRESISRSAANGRSARAEQHRARVESGRSSF